MPSLMPNTLIIDGHGATYDPKSAVGANYFDFRRSGATKCVMYSYVAEGRLMPALDSNKKIKHSVKHDGAVPSGAVEYTQSRIGGIRVRDRIIYAIDWHLDEHGDVEYDWNYELPRSWGADTIKLNAREGGTVDCLVWYSGSGPKTSKVVWFALRGEGPTDPLRSILLSAHGAFELQELRP